MKVFNLTQKIDVRLAELIQNLTQINKNHGTKGVANAMMNILKNLRNYRNGTVMIPIPIHVALMPYVQD